MDYEDNDEQASIILPNTIKYLNIEENEDNEYYLDLIEYYDTYYDDYNDY
jgi:hypothetical protein